MKKQIKNFEIVIDRSSKNLDIPQSVVSQIISHISSGHLLPGDKLPSELEMTRRFGISRISLREAMKLLEAKGFIESQGRKGKFIKSAADNSMYIPITDLLDTDFKNLGHFIDTKKVVTGEFVYMLANQAEFEQVNKMKGIIQHVLENQNEMVTYDRIDNYIEFYRALSKSTNNKIFEHMLHTMSTILKQVLRNRSKRFFSKKDNSDKVFNQLNDITIAIENKNGSLAKEALYKHTDYIKENISAENENEE
jgi:GntR family transcriptional repressor for pyruvate dehydrogenase complex